MSFKCVVLGHQPNPATWVFDLMTYSFECKNCAREVRWINARKSVLRRAAEKRRVG